MKSRVYFIAVGNEEETSSVNNKLNALLKESKVLDFIRPGYKVAVKMHFGEEGNTGFVNPAYAAVICGQILKKGCEASLSDTNTLYRGRRLNSEDHLKLAAEHGFTESSMGVKVVIPDDTNKENVSSVDIGQQLIKSAKVCRLYIDADAIVAISHFKGHMLTGFGGAIKNIGMGCASREGKLAQHCDVSPVVYADQCEGCAECEKACPAAAISIINNKSVIDRSKCVGCASCMAVCPTMAMFVDLGSGIKVQEKMAEYAYAVIKEKKNRSAFINFALKINKECDCWGAENPRIAPDAGIFISNDPVSADKATLDLVNKLSGRDIFREAHPDHEGIRHLKYAEGLGLGNLDYELISL